MRLEHHLVGGYVRYISPHIIIIIPQGSVTGPFGFVVYIHAVGKILRHHIHNVKYHIYADDIQIYLTVDPNIPGDFQSALFKLSKCVADIQRWMVESMLILNQDKTDFFVAASSHHLKKLIISASSLMVLRYFRRSLFGTLGLFSIIK